jgi:hypothetical protein
MPRQRPRASRGEVDDVVVFDASTFTDEGDTEAIVRELMRRACNIADERGMSLPATVCFIDSNGRCFRSCLLTADKAESHAEEKKDAPLPWFLVLEDGEGKVVKVRLQSDSQPTQ